MKSGLNISSIGKNALTKQEEDAHTQGITVIPEYKFPHGIFEISPSEMNSDGMLYAFGKLAFFLELKKVKNIHCGLTIVVGPQWMFVATLNQPYH